MDTPKTGSCYCGCGEPTKGHFVPGHDGRAKAWLKDLGHEPTVAQLVRLFGYGPGGRNLSEAAERAGIVKPWTTFAKQRPPRQ